MLPAQYRMKRAAEFATTVRHGVRAVQSDIVVHAWSDTCNGPSTGPRVGLIIAKSVGSAVERHQVARRVRHVARAVLDEMDPSDRIVVRALPSSRNAISARLEQQLRTGLRRTHQLRGSRR